ncbi:TPA: MotA/TolQ/ExbB proton channel family protein [Burkholderia cenocepacia]|nr:MotA/TolQ/ExbB proton channel family protein [Burkholderia cenocepacia]HDR9888544.1 MotA/TolQ/ExbB proton channel family protein [Burkholderia cenocepacia]
MNRIVDVWIQGDAISHLIVLVLIVMSLASWTVMLFKIAQLVWVRAQGAIVQQRFWQAQSLDEGMALLGRQVAGNPYRDLAEAASYARHRHYEARLREALSPDEWLQRCLGVTMEEQAARMASGLGVLASVGSTAPFVGLFGTVWGIYHALLGISAAGQSSLAQVAGPVGESLVMTALGLFVAIPAVLGYNAVSRGNRSMLQRLARFRHELHVCLMSGERRPAARNQRAEPNLMTEGGQ